MDRLSMLLNLVTTKPSDPFPRYGLAMEYRKLGRNDEAVQAFAELAEHHPKYVPGYLMHGNLLEKMGRAADARSVYERGLEVARAAGDDHAESELRSARDALT
jgi:tetratricopeptide (TPR) repeat protein